MLLPILNASANADAKIQIEMEYIVISPGEDGSTAIMDMVNVKNQTAEEYKGDGKSEGVVSILLPEGASGLQMLDGKIEYKVTDTGFVTTKPIAANGTEVLPFNYRVEAGKEIVLKFPYPVGLYQILIPEGSGSVEIEGASFSNQGLLEFDDQNYWGYSIQGIEANQTLTLGYDKDKQPDGQDSSLKSDMTNENLGNVTKTAPDFHNPGHLRMWQQSALRKFDPHILMIVLGAILIAGIGYYSYFTMKNRAQNKIAGADKEEQAFKLLMAKQKAILDKILELEESYEKGQIPEDEYHTKLEAYKHHLVQVKLSLRDYIE